ncbi:HIT family protein [Limnoglobus roseus]|uniref:HIT domain-containing protein n=1 Tax=Limnoglobus roseus TaxID=2598579 RepID=A0A5C1AS41_9BACT|nr:HIT domain-containing protein [Limnoglobus roseus]QEL19708.1 HIT domain-containing protein [Limnoglobus roseus]
MDQLWAPWRLAYAATPKVKPAEGEDCFLCRTLVETEDRANLILLRTERAVVVLNRFPYNNGHLLVCPLAHKSGLDDLTDAESLELQQLLARLMAALKRCIQPDGFNVGLNLGKVAGAGLPGHLHWHIVPRWNGDTNFMPVLTDTKVIVQSLESLYDVLKREL